VRAAGPAAARRRAARAASSAAGAGGRVGAGRRRHRRPGSAGAAGRTRRAEARARADPSAEGDRPPRAAGDRAGSRREPRARAGDRGRGSRRRARRPRASGGVRAHRARDDRWPRRGIRTVRDSRGHVAQQRDQAHARARPGPRSLRRSAALCQRIAGPGRRCGAGPAAGIGAGADRHHRRRRRPGLDRRRVGAAGIRGGRPGAQCARHRSRLADRGNAGGPRRGCSSPMSTVGIPRAEARPPLPRRSAGWSGGACRWSR